MVGRMTFSWSSLRGIVSLAFVMLMTQATPLRAQGSDRAILVDLERARIVKIPDGAQTLIIGNPRVADVTMLKTNQLMVITGKSFGTTNLIVLDRTGAQVGESIITVVPARGKLVVQRGDHRESYSCSPTCTPAIDLADDKAFMAQSIESMRLHDSSSAPVKR
jgi:hypothetical protein